MRAPWLVRAIVLLTLVVVVLVALEALGLSWTADVLGIASSVVTVGVALLAAGAGANAGVGATKPRRASVNVAPVADVSSSSDAESLARIGDKLVSLSPSSTEPPHVRWSDSTGSDIDTRALLKHVVNDGRHGHIYLLETRDPESAHVAGQKLVDHAGSRVDGPRHTFLACAIETWRQSESLQQWLQRQVADRLATAPQKQLEPTRRQLRLDAAAMVASGRIIPVLVATAQETQRVLRDRAPLKILICTWVQSEAEQQPINSDCSRPVDPGVTRFFSDQDLWSALWENKYSSGFRPPVWTPQEVRTHRLFLKALSAHNFSPPQVTSVLPWWFSDIARLLLVYFVVNWATSFNYFALTVFFFYDPWAYVLAFSLLAVAARDPGSISGVHRPIHVSLKTLRHSWLASRTWQTTGASLRVAFLAGAVVAAFNMGDVFGDQLNVDKPSAISKVVGTVEALLWGATAALVAEVALRVARRYRNAWVFSDSRFSHPPRFATLSPVAPRWRLSKVQLTAFYAYFGFGLVSGAGGSGWVIILLALLLTPALCFGIPNRDGTYRPGRLAVTTALWALGRAALLTAGLASAGLIQVVSDEALLRELVQATADAQWTDFAVVALLVVLTVLSLGLTIGSVCWIGDRAVLSIYLAIRGVDPRVWRSVTALQQRGAFIEFGARLRAVPCARLPYRTQ